MAVSGFEGFEKRLELHFNGDDNGLAAVKLGLRRIDFDSINKVLRLVQCDVVSAVGNHFFDAYVLSESSLFVYPTKMIIKTCGTTQVLKSIWPLIRLANDLGLTLCGCRYTRGSFIFPKSQPFPHVSFKQEVVYIEENLPDNLCFRKASVMLSKLPSCSWHVFSAGNGDHFLSGDTFTVEVCMTGLDRVMARKFFQTNHHSSAAKGIENINPRAFVCDLEFDPCGYSMNGVDGDRYSTIHVTPEEGFSYASFECVGSVYDDQDDIFHTLKKAVQVFKPATVSVSTTSHQREGRTRVARAMEPLGLNCRSFAMDKFPAAGTIVFQTFTAARRK
ncbi:S-adenosylmethionine decarboxylase proenzyme 4 [Hibiscus syriacus]|uniref:adenosylmethionine decarboxylase n=1 Tax=Hibiscus syriacus TaxID=106335 RepID=A0A6A3CG95_HIBSY|nr:S-adenosylmethionine decarboxylase proenzyme 4-like [Hibiscus syriacus]KAE8726352.1 S-adenosylmethionine decarboxylase proenzyme 4 [Hibiscus syriacus]